MPGYTVTKRDAAGKAVEIGCDEHAACKWRFAAGGARADTDPIFKAQFERHVSDIASPGLRGLGHVRRGRA